MTEITLDATVDGIEPVTQMIDSVLEAEDCSMKAQMQIDVAVDELFANIAHYAYEGSTGKATVRIDVDSASRVASITFIDSGIPYNPLEKEDPDITLSADERAIGGLGIFLVKKTMDSVEYKYENNQNILTIKKNI